MSLKEYKDYSENIQVYCEICKEPAEWHHIFARGMGAKGRDGKGGGCDCIENRVKLCRIHHVEAHQLGKKSFCDKYALHSVYELAVEHHYQRTRGESKCRT